LSDNPSAPPSLAQDKSNLRVIMTLLRTNAPNIQFEAFHVFKVCGMRRCTWSRCVA